MKIILILLTLLSTKLYSFTPAYPDEEKIVRILDYEFGYEVWSEHSLSSVKNTYIILGPLGYYNISKRSTQLTFLGIGFVTLFLTIYWLKKRNKKKLEQEITEES